ncbi:MAG TPA: type IV pilus assembly protein PilM [Gaiellaceae bacterium]|nr:type IV pilus assembly protein PilM [Gaiellaceae bacterium]
MASDEKPTSIWKKELSFRRKSDAERAADADASGDSGSIWKKEVSLRRQAKGADPAAEAPELEQPLIPEPVLEAALEALAAEPVAAAPPPPPEPAPAPAIEHDWLTKPLEEVSEPPDEPVLPVSPVSLVQPLPEEPVPAASPEAEPELDLPLAALPDLPAPVPVREPAAAPAPVPAAAPAPAPAEVPEAKVPFYKKELSLKRTPKAPKPPKAAKTPKAAETVQAKEPSEDSPRVPFYRRELSLRRGAKQWDAAEPVADPKPKLTRLPRPRPSLPTLPSFGRGGGNAKKIVGLKVGGSQIAAARIVNGAEPELVQAVREPLEHGIVVAGELRDPEALALALKAFFARHKLPKRGIRLGIANNRIGVRTFEVTGIADPKQLANAIRFRAQEVLPIPIEEAVLDYQVLAEGTSEDGQPFCRVLLVVAYRELVDRYLYACRKAGLQIVGIDLEAFALLRAVAEPRDPVPGSDRGALVAVAVGHERSTFAVSDGRVCEFTRVLEWGGWALNVAIARALDMAPSEVEPAKRALSLTGPEHVPDGFTEDQLATAREAARKQLQTFARELVSSLQFYQNQPGSLSIGEIVLTGGTAHLPGLGAELERLIGVPVRIADPLARVKVSKRVVEREQIGSLAVAIGLGIED